MRRDRLRPAYSPEELAVIYAVPTDSTVYDEHVERIAHIVEVLADYGPFDSVADLSTGDGGLPKGLIDAGLTAGPVYLGDFAPGYQLTGPLTETVPQLHPVDLYVLSETLEHLDDPDLVLLEIRSVAKRILLSTPDSAWDDFGNVQHYWAYDGEYLTKMLADAGFTTVHHSERLHKTSYNYRIILAS